MLWHIEYGKSEWSKHYVKKAPAWDRVPQSPALPADRLRQNANSYVGVGCDFRRCSISYWQHSSWQVEWWDPIQNTDTTMASSCRLHHSVQRTCDGASKGKDGRRFLRREHLERCPFIGFLPCRQGIFCFISCSLFAPASSTAGRSSHHL